MSHKRQHHRNSPRGNKAQPPANAQQPQQLPIPPLPPGPILEVLLNRNSSTEARLHHRKSEWGFRILTAIIIPIIVAYLGWIFENRKNDFDEKILHQIPEIKNMFFSSQAMTVQAAENAQEQNYHLLNGLIADKQWQLGLDQRLLELVAKSTNMAASATSLPAYLEAISNELRNVHEQLLTLSNEQSTRPAIALVQPRTEQITSFYEITNGMFLQFKGVNSRFNDRLYEAPETDLPTTVHLDTTKVYRVNDHQVIIVGIFGRRTYWLQLVPTDVGSTATTNWFNWGNDNLETYRLSPTEETRL